MAIKLDDNLKPIKQYDPKITTLKGSLVFFVMLMLQAIIDTMLNTDISNSQGVSVALSAAIIVAIKNFIKNHPYFQKWY